ncbi:MAG: shikimate dehydrogenase [Planctomycetota bacterium]|jgi:3-dehydroquinate dehydratase/shikimate dehydrogenase
MICVPIVATTNDWAREDLQKASAVADIAELRIDYLEEKPDLSLLLDNRPLPVIVTNRPVREGGLWEGDETGRVAYLREAVALNAEYVDIEHDAIGMLGEPLGTRVIVSYHNWVETPENLVEIARMLVGAGGNIIKMATLVRHATDLFRLCQVPSAIGVRTIVVGMGARGAPSRILSRKFGSYLTFASLSRELASAPGQVTAADLINVYNFGSTSRDSEVFGVVGNPIGHSVSPHIHNAAFRASSINAVYVPFEVEDFDAFIGGVKCLSPRGFSVTVPHKESAFRAAGAMDDVTRRIGSLNTLKFDGASISGTNTDWQAAVKSVRAAMPRGETLAGKQVLLLGAGGAARAIAYGFAHEGAEVTIANRTLERGRSLASQLGCKNVPWEERSQVEYDVLINSTSLGMYPSIRSTPFPREALKPGKVVFDAVYNPRVTRLLGEARAADCVTVDGLSMLVRQAAAQYEFWFGEKAPLDEMHRASVVGLERFAILEK